ncbi:hypothetical protein [Uliginosibacterium sp. H1]|uniref:hypothetical protein n=1 Tax=Uliginosibacterium sp. H1 TaxID=3114757 RepID=UPI002E190A6A|nr:hypothetical protein [Uliginosibacterium sp. H1]
MQQLYITAVKVRSGTDEVTHVTLGVADGDTNRWAEMPTVQDVDRAIAALDRGHPVRVLKATSGGATPGPEVFKINLPAGRSTIGFKKTDPQLATWADVPAI